MAHAPRSQEVTRAIRSLARQVGLSTKAANQQAAKRLARGDYAGAQSLIDMAKAIAAFAEEVGCLRSRWKQIRTAGRGPRKEQANHTPLWEFYRPILQALMAVGSEASRKQIESKLEGTIEGSLKEGDLATNARGVPRWKAMVGRARKQMIAEGFVSAENLLKWKITSKGEQAAKSGVKNPAGSKA